MCSASEPLSPEGIRDLLDKAEREQREKEQLVDSRKVLFSTASSADHRPRVAAAEAFDVAAAALPRPPNFCYVNISLDYAGMIDSPGVVWFNLCRANSTTPSDVKPNTLHLLGGAVSQQRLGGGYIQVLLGCIPDLETDAFTFDVVPERTQLHDPTRPPPALCFASLDTRLSLQYEKVLSSRLYKLNSDLGDGCPLIGGLYPSVDMESKNREEYSDSIFFINDRVYKGSAAGVLLRSRLLQAKSFSVVPSISLAKVVVGKVSKKDGVVTIGELDGCRATDVIEKHYKSKEMEGKRSHIFLGIPHKKNCLPVSFTGNPSTGCIQYDFFMDDLPIADGATVDLLVDESELDTEIAAGYIIAEEKALKPVSVEKDVTIAREARRNVTVSSTAALHFSHFGLNNIARPDTPVLSLGNNNTLFAPSILQRCAGRTCPNSGIFVAGQVASVGDLCGIFARSSTYCFLQGIE